MNINQHRQIRSFVRREGRMTDAQLRAFTDLWSNYGLEIEAGMLDRKKVFGRDAQLVLEIGFGMGDTLFELASQNPDTDYLGIEVHRPGVGALFSKIKKQQLTNVRVYCADAIEVLQQCISNESLSKVLLLFPDPWPKQRHHKRRIVQIKFVELIKTKLKAGGVLHMATDWQNYAEHMQKVMVKVEGFVQLKNSERPQTKFERRGLKLNHQIVDLVYQKATV